MEKIRQMPVNENHNKHNKQAIKFDETLFENFIQECLQAKMQNTFAVTGVIPLGNISFPKSAFKKVLLPLLNCPIIATLIGLSRSCKRELIVVLACVLSCVL